MKYPHTQLHNICGCVKGQIRPFGRHSSLHRCHELNVTRVFGARRTVSSHAQSRQLYPSHPRSPQSYRRPYNAPHKRHVRSSSTAVASQPSENADVEDEENGETATGSLDSGTIQKSSVSRQFRFSDMLLPGRFASRIKKFLESTTEESVGFKHANVVDALLPDLAALLRLEHVIVNDASSSHPAESGSDKYHVLVKPTTWSIPRGNVEEMIEDFVHEEFFTKHLTTVFDDLKGRRGDLLSVDTRAWRLLMAACRGRPLAMPTPELIWDNGPHTTNIDKIQSASRLCQIRFRNEYYNISITYDTPDQMCETDVHHHVLIPYCEAIWDAVRKDETDLFNFYRSRIGPAEFLSKGLSDLDWPEPKFIETKLSGCPSNARSLDLWRIEIEASGKGAIGPPMIWCGQKQTRLLALIQASIPLKSRLQAAHNNGELSDGDYQSYASHWKEDVSVPDQTNIVRNTASVELSVHNIQVETEVVAKMLGTLKGLIQHGFASTYQWFSSEDLGLKTEPSRVQHLQRNAGLDYKLRKRQRVRSSDPIQDPNDLPILKEEVSSNILRAIDDSDVTILTAATGSGKTTQVPQLIFDQFIADLNGSKCNIVCTQPRRVSTVTVASRVASERGQEVGEDVGYKVRSDVKGTRYHRGIVYMTSGYLLRQLEANPVAMLQKYSHIILDEVHTRDMDTDLLLTAFRNLLDKKVMDDLDLPKLPKIILMSATIEAQFFEKYFRDLSTQPIVSTIDVPGKMFPVEMKDLDHVLRELSTERPEQLTSVMHDAAVAEYVDRQQKLATKSQEETEDPSESEGQASSNMETEVVENDLSNLDVYVPTPLIHLLIMQLLSTTTSGDILVFLPGLAEIDALEKLLLESPISKKPCSDSRTLRIFKLHSALYETNYDAFKEIPDGCRRVVLATNIAETSITLPGVKYVLDTGRSRQSTFNQATETGTFGLKWVSRAEVTQRKGRAGRTSPGTYYGLYSKGQYEMMAEAPLPEMLISRLDHLVLRCSSSSAFQIREERMTNTELLAGHALLDAPSSPAFEEIAAAAQQLRNIHALDSNGKSTPMGNILSRLIMPPAAGKAVLLGLIFKCMDAMMLYGVMREDFPLMFHSESSSLVAGLRRKLARGADDDKWADSRGFFLYDERRKMHPKAAIGLKEQLYIRQDAYCDQASLSTQNFQTISKMLGTNDDAEDYDDDDLPKPRFPETPQFLNVNGANPDLLKALSLSTVGNRLAIWNQKNWRSRNHLRVLPTPRSVNHAASRQLKNEQRIRREAGDILAYGTMRTITKERFPWIYETSVVTPLMAILFAESVALDEENSAFVINGWIKYKINSQSIRSDSQRTVKIIWEYRKALDRFIALALQMISAEPENLSKVKSGELSVEQLNKFFKETDHPFRTIITNSVIEILDIDAKVRAERARMRAQEIETAKDSGNFQTETVVRKLELRN